MANDYSGFFLNSRSDIMQIGCYEIAHPAFSKTWRVQRNVVSGLTVVHETGTSRTYTYYPLQEKFGESRNNLDMGIELTFGDLGLILPQEVSNIDQNREWSIKPTLTYRLYRYDNLAAPILGPYVLTITDFATNYQGTILRAEAPRLSINKTGEIYDINRFPMLRGFL